MSPQWLQVPWEGAARSPLILNPFVNWAHSHSPGQRLWDRNSHMACPRPRRAQQDRGGELRGSNAYTRHGSPPNDGAHLASGDTEGSPQDAYACWS